MNKVTVIGLLLGSVTIVVDRYCYELPGWLATVLLSAACSMIIAGMIESRKPER